jgi:Mlc titration factor MtfA (ptsG expression regulator)
MSKNYDGWYLQETGQIKCWDKNTCLHEVVHKYDWENGGEQISETKEFKIAITEYISNIDEEQGLSYLEYYVCNFPGVTAEYRIDGWGGLAELYAEIFTVSEMYNFDIPEEFVKFYDADYIYKLWEQYPNIWSRL